MVQLPLVERLKSSCQGVEEESGWIWLTWERVEIWFNESLARNGATGVCVSSSIIITR